MAQDIQDDGFHEIQLNGKQLVFLFMAATVVSVVIFLCGVLVGRGVRAERVVESASVAPVIEAPPQPVAAPPAPPAESDPTKAPAPTPANEDLSYFDRLGKQNASAEQLKPKAAAAAAPVAKPEKAEKAPRPEKIDKPVEKRAEKAPEKTPEKAIEKPAERPAATAGAAAAPAAVLPSAADAHPAATGAADPGGQGFAVQIAALNIRSEADAIAKRLTSKGYSAYVLAPADGTPAVFRVRVGKFPTRREAESIAAKLQKEEQFKPWVTR